MIFLIIGLVIGFFFIILNSNYKTHFINQYYKKNKLFINKGIKKFKNGASLVLIRIDETTSDKYDIIYQISNLLKKQKIINTYDDYEFIGIKKKLNIIKLHELLVSANLMEKIYLGYSPNFTKNLRLELDCLKINLKKRTYMIEEQLMNFKSVLSYNPMNLEYHYIPIFKSFNIIGALIRLNNEIKKEYLKYYLSLNNCEMKNFDKSLASLNTMKSSLFYFILDNNTFKIQAEFAQNKNIVITVYDEKNYKMRALHWKNLGYKIALYVNNGLNLTDLSLFDYVFSTNIKGLDVSFSNKVILLVDNLSQKTDVKQMVLNNEALTYNEFKKLIPIVNKKNN